MNNQILLKKTHLYPIIFFNNRYPGILPIIFLISLYLFVAIHSIGYHHVDEHYQIIQFAEYRLGNAEEISWEFHQNVRSSIQPLMCITVFTISRSLGILNHFDLALILRLFSGVISAYSIYFFIRSCKGIMSENDSVLLIVFYCCIWFIPYINVRFSSETWSGIFCLLAISQINLFLKDSLRFRYSLIGILFGFAFLFRFQVIAIEASSILWIIFIKKVKLRHALNILVHTFLVILIGVILDYFFYEKLTFTLYNYIYFNLIDGVFVTFGITPWYDIFNFIIVSPFIPIGVIILLSLLILLFFNYRNLYLWCVLPFIVFHALAPHKELRFLFPIANLAPVILLTSFQTLRKININVKNYLKIYFAVSLVSINMLGLLVIAIKSTNNGKTEVASYIYKNYNEVRILSSEENNLFEPRINFKTHFFKKDGAKMVEINSIWQDDINKFISNSQVNLLILSNSETIDLADREKLQRLGFREVMTTTNSFINVIVKIYDENIFDSQLKLYELNKKKL